MRNGRSGGDGQDRSGRNSEKRAGEDLREKGQGKQSITENVQSGLNGSAGLITFGWWACFVVVEREWVLCYNDICIFEPLFISCLRVSIQSCIRQELFSK